MISLLLSAALIFSEPFADDAGWRQRWSADGTVETVADGRGSHAIRIGVRENHFTQVRLRDIHRIAVKPGIPVLVRWEARTPDGGAPAFFRYDWYRADGSHISAHQLRSVVEPTQPTLFMTNERRLEPPAEAVTLGITFHHCPIPGDKIPTLIANLQVLDLSAEIAARDRRRAAVAAERTAAAPDRLLAYASDDPGAAFPILPKGLDVPGRAGEPLRIRECPGEHARASVTLWTKMSRTDVRLSLQGKLPARISAKLVKCHWQAEGAPAEVVVTGPGKTLVPEYLLNDGELVRVDEERGTEALKLADGRGYLDALGYFTPHWGADVSVAQVPIADAAEFRPFALAAERNQQLIVKFEIDPAAAAGDYDGELAFTAGGTEIGTVPVRLTVLPFALPAHPATAYDPARKYTMGLYYWGQVKKGAEPAMSLFNKSREQFLNELRLMREYSIDTPLLVWQPAVVNDEKAFRENLAAAREAGLRDTLYLAGSGVIGNPQKPEELESLKAKIANLRQLAGEYGFHTVYFYGLDEAKGEKLLSQLPAWKAVHAAGGKVIVSGYRGHFEQVGPELDICVYADDPESAVPANWHRLGHRLFKYATPQSGVEDPNQYRRSYGMGLWKRGFDGASTYCFCGETFGWNDFDDSHRAQRPSGIRFRALNLGYLTRDGAVATLAMCGLDEAMKDVRYLSLCQRLLRERPNAAAQKWFEAISFASDPATVRREAIEWILRLQAESAVCRSACIDDSHNFGLWSLVPLIVTIVLAFATREVVLSLFAGILSGGVIYAFGTGGGLISAPTVVLRIMGEHLAANIHMVIFLLMLGSLVAVISAAGGAQAYGEWAFRRLKSRRMASLLTALFGIIIFIDDYFNCLTIGTVMRPVTDKFRISREKLAYIIDATSAPVCILAPISSWAAYVVSCIPKDTCGHGMSLFLASMPFNFYAIGALIFVFAVCIYDRLEFGPMRDAERVTRRGHDVGADRHAAVGMAAVPVVGKGRVWDLVLPIVALIVFAVLSMLRDGGFFSGTVSFARAFANADSGPALSLASFGAIAFAFLLFVPRKLIGFKDFSNVVVLGMKTMIPAVVMLTLAWTISGVCDELLATGQFVKSSLEASSFPMWCLPAVFFVVAAFLSFATGASWGTIGILVPVAAEIFSGSPASHSMFASALLLGAVLAGAVQGDHCSPISDTTILSSTGAGCRHHNHVVTQMPYSLAVGSVSLLGYLLAGYLLI